MKNNKAKERAKIYLQAAKFFTNKKDISLGICGFCDFIDEKYNCDDFIEYQLFKPKSFNLYWFKHSSEGNMERVTALLFAHYMALDEKE